MLITYPLMAAIQEISGRIGRVTGHGIAELDCSRYRCWRARRHMPSAKAANGPSGSREQTQGGRSLLRCADCAGRAWSGTQLYPIDPIKALYWSAVINGVLAAPVMIVMMLMVRRKSVMGDLVVRGPVYWLGWISTGAMGLCIVGMAMSMWS
jgi:Mn2+/Fe2+ NRAMP family transporter